MANTLKLHRNGAVGFIVWLGGTGESAEDEKKMPSSSNRTATHILGMVSRLHMAQASHARAQDFLTNARVAILCGILFLCLIRGIRVIRGSSAFSRNASENFTKYISE